MNISPITASRNPEILADLRKDPVVQLLATGLRGIPRTDLVTPSGELRYEFLHAANEEYARRGGEYTKPRPFGSVGEALISLLERQPSPDELYHSIPDGPLERMIARVQRREREVPDPVVRELLAGLLAEQSRRRG